MANILDYLDWRGDIPMTEDSFNEIDGLILSQFVYLSYEGIVDEDWDKTITIEEAGRKYFRCRPKGEEESLTLMVNNCSEVVRRMLRTDRFRKLQICGFVEKFDPVTAKQFAAVTVKISDECVCVVYRGTDDSLTGWEEDFKLCYMLPVESQLEAKMYLQSLCEVWDGRIILGGHSKGGNLSIYAAMCLCDEYKDRILKIYNYDGPGFLPAVVESEEYLKILPRINSYLPQSSMIGMIMYNESRCEIVKSTEKGFFQHKAVSWEVYGPRFVNADKFDKTSIWFNNACKKWVEEIETDKREVFFDHLFQLFKSAEIGTLTEISNDFPMVMKKVIRSYSDLDKDTKKMLRGIVKQMLKLSTETIKENRLIGRKDNNG